MSQWNRTEQKNNNWGWHQFCSDCVWIVYCVCSIRRRSSIFALLYRFTINIRVCKFAIFCSDTATSEIIEPESVSYSSLQTNRWVFRPLLCCCVCVCVCVQFAWVIHAVEAKQTTNLFLIDFFYVHHSEMVKSARHSRNWDCTQLHDPRTLNWIFNWLAYDCIRV